MHTLRNVSAGFAEVVNENGRRIGTVSRDDPWTVVSGVRWSAYRGPNRVGYGDTRSEAIAALVAHIAERDAKLAAFLNR